ncbi:general transcription and DNA repair factor IIH helicase/translocase subunit XPB-like [Prorops nasuta]|uniref:general transcription and DNA repair factor IIH helicase/translocase subunit XPB-like n=1 Tax=Prorops nasuta TaxID=863751 RepID=UPI0034CEDE61
MEYCCGSHGWLNSKVNKHYIYDPTRVKVKEYIKIFKSLNSIPKDNILVQISSLGESRRQEAQHLERILRNKKGAIATEYESFSYTCVSQDTIEMNYYRKRQRFLFNQDYAYRVITQR